MKQVSQFVEIIKKDLSKDLTVAHDPLIEVKATFFRALKIWWSLVWRGLIILMVLGVLFFGAAKLFENTLFGTFVKWMDEPMTMNGTGIPVMILIALGVFVLLNLIICLLFKLIIGKQYKDFQLDFIPSAFPGWSKICRISWRYLIIMISISFIGGVLEVFSLNLPFGVAISFGLTVITELLRIYAIAFIVNRSYGDVRLSLLKLEK